MAVLPGSTLGILGGGQLGRMFAGAAKRLGYRIAVLEPSPDSPCAQIADTALQASYTDENALKELASISHALTYEFENVDAGAVEFLERQGKPIHPSSRVLRITQDRILEKTFARKHGIPVTAFAGIRTAQELEEAMTEVGLPAFLKTCRGGYDGKGQVRIETAEEGRKALADFSGRDLILERLVPFTREMSLVACRGSDGAFTAYPPSENGHVRSVLDISIYPARVSPATAEAAREIARKVAEGLEIVGTFCVEFFVLADGSLLLNEIAPRPHNSGHATLDACLCSQFEQQVRAVCGLPLGSTELLSSAAMINILGTGEGDRLVGVEELLSHPEVSLHLYGKNHAPRGRKMGHFTVLADTADAAESKARILQKMLRWD
jgi:5-(carboxyamino)imidazole ribonucleotide synthase